MRYDVLTENFISGDFLISQTGREEYSDM